MTETVQTTAMPGDGVTLTPLPDYPGLHPMWTWADGRAHYELAWQAGTGEVIRVRYQAVEIDPAMPANMPLAPRQLCMMVSASLVDEAGQVIAIGGRGMVRPAQSFTIEVQPGAIDADATRARWARIQAEELLAFRDQMMASTPFIPPPQPAPEPEPEGAPA
ncbi:hypothetical protein GO308_12905 [Sphingomonas sp. SFZ2018-12]|uniref:hypothetical protein n=1 Tax=Sphingomonas sp. SFZ2018-12 TaxID=2683197 RepID=UPI001F0E812D|nr:hypothetical protein [Sphingomonas sp. SFZ2018-12]MCH4894015.1 hypothetical protein [Sphingomonas sp. SFZ2018-12]